jgi:hypothetical protein
MKKIFDHNGNRFEMVKTKKVMSILRHDYNNGFVSIDLTQDELYFNIVINCIPDSYAGIIYNDYCNAKSVINGYDVDFICPVMDDYKKSVHPLWACDYFGANAAPRYQDKREIKFILNLIRFACYNNMSVFIEGYDQYPEIEQFLFEPVGLINCSELNDIVCNLPFELLDKWYNFTTVNTKRAYEAYQRSNREGIYLPISEIKKLRKIVDDFGYIEYSYSAACIEWSSHRPFAHSYTLDGVYSYNVYYDEILEGDVSDNIDLVYLYLDEDQYSYNYISQWVYDQCSDWLYDNDYRCMNDGEYYHTDCLWYDGDIDEWRFESDQDEEEENTYDNDYDHYVHCYHYSGNLKAPEKFNEGAKFQIGLEIEVEFPENENIFALTEDIVESYSDSEHNFHLERDASLRDASFEMVTAPIIYNKDLPEWLENSIKEINKYNPKFWNCGGHVHIDRMSFNSSFSRQLFIYLFNNFKEMVEQISGRDGYCSYARFQYPSSIEMINLWDNDMEQKEESDNYNYRYCVVNRENPKTIEVRIFKGTTDLRVIQKRIDTLKNMVEFCNQYILNNTITDDNLDNINKISWLEFSGLTMENTMNF